MDKKFKAINEGRQAAREIDLDLMGHTSLAGPAGVVISNNKSKGSIMEKNDKATCV